MNSSSSSSSQLASIVIVPVKRDGPATPSPPLNEPKQQFYSNNGGGSGQNYRDFNPNRRTTSGPRYSRFGGDETRRPANRYDHYVSPNKFSNNPQNRFYQQSSNLISCNLSSSPTPPQPSLTKEQRRQLFEQKGFNCLQIKKKKL